MADDLQAGVDFVYRPTILVCDGDNTWEIQGSSDYEITCAMDEYLPGTIEEKPWLFVAPTGCQSCTLCMEKLSKRLKPGEKRCTRCSEPTSDYDYNLREGFCRTCDMRHYNAWHESERKTTFSEWRQCMKEQYTAVNQQLRSE